MLNPHHRCGQNYCTKIGNKYIFKLGSTIKYEYTLGTDGSFLPIKTYVGSTFSASDGGIFVEYLDSSDYSIKTAYSWDATYTLLGERLDLDNGVGPNGTVVAEWIMKIPNGREWWYRYKMRIEGITLVINVEVLSNKDWVRGINMNQCGSDAASPVPISIPYLPFFYVLKANDQFTSFFADWQKSEASEIVPFDITQAEYSNNRFYGQLIIYKQLTNYSRNPLNETLYLTTSSEIEDVFPNIEPNPISSKKSEVANTIMWDHREPYRWLLENQPEATLPRIPDLQRMKDAGINNLWLQIHFWQRKGFDNGLPGALPANDGLWHLPPTVLSDPSYNTTLGNIIQQARSNYGCTFVGLHHNYVDYYRNAVNANGVSVFLEANTAKDSGWKPVNAFRNLNVPLPDGQSLLLKPTLAQSYATDWSNQIHTTFSSVNSSYLDVHSATLPFSDRVDFQFGIDGAGKFRSTLNAYRGLFDILRNSFTGPVQGEGGNEPFYLGYVDDVDARITLPVNRIFNTQNFPLFIDFERKKLRSKAFVHGVGYYPCFYWNSENEHQYLSDEIVLKYIATELAYGHGSYLPTPNLTPRYIQTENFNFDDILRYATWEKKHVFSMRNTFLNATPDLIRYNNGAQQGDANLLSASDFIRAHPTTYDKITSNDFMGQVKIEYSNGVIIYINRHPSRTWTVYLGTSGGWFNYHADGTCQTGTRTYTTFSLPINSGWVIYDPNHIAKQSGLTETIELPAKFDIEQNYPNPFNPTTIISYTLPQTSIVTIRVYDILGGAVKTVVDRTVETGNYTESFDGSNYASGIYFIRLIAQPKTGMPFVKTIKIVMTK